MKTTFGEERLFLTLAALIPGAPPLSAMQVHALVGIGAKSATKQVLDELVARGCASRVAVPIPNGPDGGFRWAYFREQARDVA